MYKFALVGCGRISKNHVEAINQIENARLVACCDIVPERAEAVAGQTDCTAFSDYATMLRETDCDMISICTPSGLHPLHVQMAAEAGRHALSEKPAGTSLADVDGAIEAAEKAGTLYMEVKQNRFNRTIQLLRKAIDAGRFGKIYMVLSNVFWTRPQEYYDMAPWRGTWKMDGGCLSNQAAHYVDMVQWFGGPVENVQAFGATQARDIEAEDSIVVNLRFRSGALGSINVTVLTYPKNLEGSITILGEKGTARIGGVAMNKIEDWQFADEHPMDAEVEQANYAPKSVYGSGHLDYYKHVIDVLDGKTTPLVTGREGRKTVEILERAYESAETRVIPSLVLHGQEIK